MDRSILFYIPLFFLFAIFLTSASIPAQAEESIEIKEDIHTEEPEIINWRAPRLKESPNAETNSYLLNPGDRLKMTVFGVEDLSGEFEIDRNGQITVPPIGEIDAAGRTKIDLQQEITDRLIEQKYFKNPNITVEIIALKPFYILGEVKSPGSYNYVPSLDVFKAVALAGGYTPRASKGRTMIIREVNGQKQYIRAAEETEILPGDSIKVKQRFF